MGALAAASYPPPNSDYDSLHEHCVSWAFANPWDDVESIIRNGRNVWVCVESLDNLERFLYFRGLTCENTSFAFQITSGTTVHDAASFASPIVARLVECGLPGAQVHASDSFAHKNLLEYGVLTFINGLLLLDATFASIMKLLTQDTSQSEKDGS